jgi:hypothetical protein
MKLNSALLFYVPYILSAPQEKTQLPGCMTKFECKMSEITEKMKTEENRKKCAKFIDDEEAMYNCFYKIAGLRDDQISILSNLMSTPYSCEPSPEIQFKKCISKCASDKSCIEICVDNKNEKTIECLANQLKVKDFDAKKAVQCSKQCTQDTLSEVMDCDTKCKEPLYKKFDYGAKDINSGSQADSKNYTTSTNSTAKSDSKDSESTSTTNSSSSDQSSGISDLSTGLFSIVFPILFVLIL